MQQNFFTKNWVKFVSVLASLIIGISTILPWYSINISGSYSSYGSTAVLNITANANLFTGSVHSDPIEGTYQGETVHLADATDESAPVENIAWGISLIVIAVLGLTLAVVAVFVQNKTFQFVSRIFSIVISLIALTLSIITFAQISADVDKNSDSYTTLSSNGLDVYSGASIGFILAIIFSIIPIISTAIDFFLNKSQSSSAPTTVTPTAAPVAPAPIAPTIQTTQPFPTVQTTQPFPATQATQPFPAAAPIAPVQPTPITPVQPAPTTQATPTLTTPITSTTPNTPQQPLQTTQQPTPPQQPQA